MAKPKKEVLAAEASKIQEKLASFLKDNSFQSGELTLDLQYNAWAAGKGQEPFSYYLKNKNSTAFNFSLQELSALKTFLNSITIME